MSEIELKPCPFCGEKTYTRITLAANNKMEGYISCNNSNCAIKMNFTIKAENILLSFEDVINGLHNVADKWNRRADNETD